MSKLNFITFVFIFGTAITTHAQIAGEEIVTIPGEEPVISTDEQLIAISENERVERPFAISSDCFKGTSKVKVGKNKEEREFYLLVETTNNLPILVKTKEGEASPVGYAFYLTTRKSSEETKEVLLSQLILEKNAKINDEGKAFDYVSQGKKTSITLLGDKNSMTSTKVTAEQLSVESDEPSKKSKPTFKDLNIKLEHRNDIKECLPN